MRQSLRVCPTCGVSAWDTLSTRAKNIVESQVVGGTLAKLSKRHPEDVQGWCSVKVMKELQRALKVAGIRCPAWERWSPADYARMRTLEAKARAEERAWDKKKAAQMAETHRRETAENLRRLQEETGIAPEDWPFEKWGAAT